MSQPLKIDFTEKKVKDFFLQNPDIYERYLGHEILPKKLDDYVIVDGKFKGEKVNYIFCGECILNAKCKQCGECDKCRECKHDAVVILESSPKNTGIFLNDVREYFTVDELVTLGYIPYTQMNKSRYKPAAEKQLKKCQLAKLIKPERIIESLPDYDSGYD